MIPASASGDAQAFAVAVSGIDDVFMTRQGTAETAADVDRLLASSPPPLSIQAQANFILGAPGAMANQCTSDLGLNATTAARTGEFNNSLSWVCPLGSVDADSDGICDEADACSGDDSNT